MHGIVCFILIVSFVKCKDILIALFTILIDTICFLIIYLICIFPNEKWNRVCSSDAILSQVKRKVKFVLFRYQYVGKNNANRMRLVRQETQSWKL